MNHGGTEDTEKRKSRSLFLSAFIRVYLRLSASKFNPAPVNKLDARPSP